MRQECSRIGVQVAGWGNLFILKDYENQAVSLIVQGLHITKYYLDQ